MDYGAFKTFDFRDICITEFDDTFEKYHSVNTPLSRLPRIHTQGLIGEEFELFGRVNSHDSVQECFIPAEHWVVQLPYPRSDCIKHYQEHPEGSKHSLLTKPKDEFTWHIGADLPAMAMVVRHSALENLFSQDDLATLSDEASKIFRRNLLASRLAIVARQAAFQLSSLPKGMSLQANSAINENLREIAIETYSLILDSLNGDVKTGNRERVLTNALYFIRQNYTQDLRLIDIVNHAHTTTRTLQLVFKQHLGLTPLQFIKRYRLARFHRGLRQYGSVTEAAVYSGLRHMGRLPDHYRSIFGENPGDYLMKIREQADEVI